MIRLAIGSLVMLKSGSFPMTVFGITEEIIDAVWMNGAILMRDAFHFDELVELVMKDIEYVKVENEK